MRKEYPVEIYPKPNERIKDSAERIYDLGFEQGRLEGRREKLEPDVGWTRLTTANPDWGRIDWTALYGRPTILTHSASFSVISTEIISKGPHTVGYDDGTREIPAHQALLLKAPPKMVHSALHGATQSALEGKDSWALYVCGDLPLRKRTADDLESGTIFEAVLTDEEEFGPATILRVDAGIIDVGDWQILDADLTCIEVSRVLGNFQTPKENQ